MSLQLSITVRDNALDQIESTIGTSPKLEFFTGSPPANCGTADSGTKLATLTLPSDWMNAASAGAKTLLGSWTGSVSVAGTAGYFRIKDSSDTTCGLQGTVTITGGGGDMILDNNVLAVSQVITINAFTLTAGNA